MWLQPLCAILFFCQRILQGSLSKPPCSLSLALGSVLVEGLASALPYQCMVTSLVVKDWCPLATKMEGKIKVF